MNENPDIAAHEKYVKLVKPENTKRYPNVSELRFIERDDKRILQQFQWSQELNEFDWYDVPMVSDNG